MLYRALPSQGNPWPEIPDSSKLSNRVVTNATETPGISTRHGVEWLRTAYTSGQHTRTRGARGTPVPVLNPLKDKSHRTFQYKTAPLRGVVVGVLPWVCETRITPYE